MERCPERLRPPHKTLYNRFIRWSRVGVIRPYLRSMSRGGAKALAHYDRHHTPESTSHGCEPAQKGGVPRRIGRTKGGLNSKLHAVCDGAGKPIILLLSEGQMSDHEGARLILKALPSATCLIADRGHDSNWFREALADKDIEPCIPPTKNRKVPIAYDKALYRQRHKVENMFAKLKDWRRIAMRYDRHAHTFFSAICIAATMIFWL
ncbi:IS5 family transposase (plasmid) [Ensifer sp. D2-11]